MQPIVKTIIENTMYMHGPGPGIIIDFEILSLYGVILILSIGRRYNFTLFMLFFVPS